MRPKKGYSKYFDRINQRRHELWRKHYADGLDERETKVLEWLQEHLSSFEPPMPMRNLEVMVWEMKSMQRRRFPRGSQYPAPKEMKRLN